MRTCNECSTPVLGFGNGSTMFCGDECRYINRRNYRRERIEKIKVWVDEIKVQEGCADCGYNIAPIALDFDHLPGYEKEKNVSLLVNQGKHKDVIMAEIAKCEVVPRTKSIVQYSLGFAPLVSMIKPAHARQRNQFG